MPYHAPLSVDFDITLACNLRCLHCNVAGGQAHANELPLPRVKSALDEFYEAGVFDLAITGGEPLCRPDWQEIVRHACQYDGWTVAVNTNGILWSEADAAGVAGLRTPPRIVVSLDGHNPQAYGALRVLPDGEGAFREFDKVVENILLMKRCGLRVFVNFTMTRKTVDHLFGTIDLCSQLGVEAFLGIKLFSSAGRCAAHGELALTYGQWRDLLIELTKRKQEGRAYYDRVSVSVMCPWEFYVPLSSLGLTAADTLRLWNYLSPLCNPNYRTGRSIGCTAGVTNCGVQSDGTIFPCGIVSARVAGLECGSLAAQSFEEIWSSSVVLNRFRRLSIDRLDARCRECSFSDTCGGGCRSRAYLGSGDLAGPDLECPFLGA